MHCSYTYSISRRVKTSFSLLLCACIVVSTLISTSFAMASTMSMPSKLSSEIPTQLHNSSVMAHHDEVDSNLSKIHPDQPTNAENSHHMQHDVPCDNCDHPGKSDCPEICIANLCCTATGLSSFFNTLQLDTPILSERYLICISSRLQSQQPSPVLRPPIV